MMLIAAYPNVRRSLMIGGLFCGIAAGQDQPVPPGSIPISAPVPQTQLPAHHDPKVSPVPSLPVVTRGEMVPVVGENFPSQGVLVFLRSGHEAPGDNGTQVPATATADGRSLTFRVPRNPFKTGRYLVVLQINGKELAVPGDLVIGSDDTAKVEIDSISPATDYLNSRENAYDFEISGENMAPVASDNIIEADGRGPLTVSKDSDCKPGPRKDDPVCLVYASGLEGRKLLVTGYHPDHYEGPVSFRVHTANSVSEPKKVVFSSISEMELRALAIAVSILIGMIVLGLVWKGIGVYRIADKEYSPLQSFFLDRETNTYSLSKFQLLAWTLVAVFGYIYLLFCQSLIQWNFSFPDIPSGWPTLLGISAATTVTAVGITSSHGSKGAGPVSPSLADFITSGGMVMSSRFQFFVWTLVGCAGFLFLTLKNDPSSLTNLPDVPSGFLYLMGISAGGYLGGKLVSLPGPVVKTLLVSAVATNSQPAQMMITLKGENLSRTATVKVDGKDLRTNEFTIECVTPQDQAPDPTFCTECKVTLRNADDYLEGLHKLTLTNNDGQMAVSNFPLDGLTITSVGPVKSGTPAPFAVNGNNFADGMTAIWRNATGVEAAIESSGITKQSDTQLAASFIPGPSGLARLTLISSIGLRCHVDVNVT
jgi:hypothetical protein